MRLPLNGVYGYISGSDLLCDAAHLTLLHVRPSELVQNLGLSVIDVAKDTYLGDRGRGKTKGDYTTLHLYI